MNENHGSEERSKCIYCSNIMMGTVHHFCADYLGDGLIKNPWGKTPQWCPGYVPNKSVEKKTRIYQKTR